MYNAGLTTPSPREPPRIVDTDVRTVEAPWRVFTEGIL